MVKSNASNAIQWRMLVAMIRLTILYILTKCHQRKVVKDVV